MRVTETPVELKPARRGLYWIHSLNNSLLGVATVEPHLVLTCFVMSFCLLVYYEYKQTIFGADHAMLYLPSLKG